MMLFMAHPCLLAGAISPTPTQRFRASRKTASPVPGLDRPKSDEAWLSEFQQLGPDRRAGPPDFREVARGAAGRIADEVGMHGRAGRPELDFGVGLPPVDLEAHVLVLAILLDEEKLVTPQAHPVIDRTWKRRAWRGARIGAGDTTAVA